MRTNVIQMNRIFHIINTFDLLFWVSFLRFMALICYFSLALLLLHCCATSNAPLHFNVLSMCVVIIFWIFMWFVVACWTFCNGQMWPMLSPCVFMFEIKMCNLYSWTLLVFKRNRFKSTDNTIISKIRARFGFFSISFRVFGENFNWIVIRHQYNNEPFVQTFMGFRAICSFLGNLLHLNDDEMHIEEQVRCLITRVHHWKINIYSTNSSNYIISSDFNLNFSTI